MIRHSFIVSVAIGSLLFLSAAPAGAQEPLPELPKDPATPTEPPKLPPPATPEQAPAPPPPVSPVTPVTPESAPPPEQPPALATEPEKRIGVGLDLAVVVPFGAFSNRTGLVMGPMLRLGYRLVPPLELLLKFGFLYGLSTADGTTDASVNIIPTSLGARYFVMNPHAGLYAGADVVLNVLVPKASRGGNDIPGLKSQTRLGANLGVGYVISKELPIDIRAQLMLFNLLLTDDATVGGATIAEDTNAGIGISVGYTFAF